MIQFDYNSQTLESLSTKVQNKTKYAEDFSFASDFVAILLTNLKNTNISLSTSRPSLSAFLIYAFIGGVSKYHFLKFSLSLTFHFISLSSSGVSFRDIPSLNTDQR